MADKEDTQGQKKKGDELPGAAANLPQTGLTMEQIQIRERGIKDFFSKEEMIKFMSDKHGVTKNSVAAVFEEMMKGENSAAYLKASEQISHEREQKAEIDALLVRCGDGGDGAFSSSSSSSSSSRGRGKGRRGRRGRG